MANVRPGPFSVRPGIGGFNTFGRGLNGLGGLGGIPSVRAGLGGIGNINGLGGIPSVRPMLNGARVNGLGNGLGGLPLSPLGAFSPLVGAGVNLNPLLAASELNALTVRPELLLRDLQLGLASRGCGYGYNNIIDFYRRATETPCCGESGCAGGLKTKSVAIRGNNFNIRYSYLAEVPKFEADIVKYMEKRTEEAVPDKTVHMLVDFINQEAYTPAIVFDDVMVNILASNVGAKSAVEYSLKQIKSRQYGHDIYGISGAVELVKIMFTIQQSSKVDSNLRGWLIKLLEANDCALYWAVHFHPDAQKTLEERPELFLEYRRLIKIVHDPKDEYQQVL